MFTTSAPSAPLVNLTVSPPDKTSWPIQSFDDILFDDEIGNRENWEFGQAYDVDNIIEVLKNF